jgi:hypothetical protein
MVAIVVVLESVSQDAGECKDSRKLVSPLGLAHPCRPISWEPLLSRFTAKAHGVRWQIRYRENEPTNRTDSRIVSPGQRLVRATGLEPARLSTPGPKTPICRFSGVVWWWEMVSELGFRESVCQRVVGSFGLFCAVPLAIR